MTTSPKIQHRSKQPYAAIRTDVVMENISTELPPLIPKVKTWLEKNKIKPVGGPFFQYLTYDNTTRKLHVSVGFPVEKEVPGDEKITIDAFPEGDYAVEKYTGDYKNLNKAHRELESWATKNGYDAGHQTKNGVDWGSRTEFYLNDPQDEPNPEKWETEIAFLVSKQ
ncbi:MAG: GyrI-like domain-containing protein [Chitinophagaceae bacterium]